MTFYEVWHFLFVVIQLLDCVDEIGWLRDDQRCVHL